jgi:hypothetical protein
MLHEESPSCRIEIRSVLPMVADAGEVVRCGADLDKRTLSPMVTKRQAADAQAARLAEGRCRVHGFAFAQVGIWFQIPGAEAPCLIARCARRTCELHVLQQVPGGPAVLLSRSEPIRGYECTRYKDKHGVVQWACAEDLLAVWPALFPW